MASPDESYELMMSGPGGIPAQTPAPAAPVVTPTTQVAPRQEPAPANRPAETRPAAPAQSGGQETIEALRQLLTQFQNRATTPRPEPRSGGLLEALRQRVQTQMAEEDDRRIRDIGIGMLASRSPNFFTMLGEGFKAGEEGARARMERLRQAAEAERQERSLEGQEAARRAEEAYRQESLRLRREEAARAGRPQFQFLAGANPGEVVAVDPRDPTRIIPVPGARLATDRSSREETILRQNARNRALTDVSRMERAITDAGGRPLTAEQRQRLQDEAEDRELAIVGLTRLPGSGASQQQQQPAPGGRPVVREDYVPPEQRR